MALDESECAGVGIICVCVWGGDHNSLRLVCYLLHAVPAQLCKRRAGSVCELCGVH